jgi:hypothetical protein
MLMESVFQDCQKTYEVANQEYAAEGDALANFNADADRLQIDRKISWSVLAGKHWRGINSFILGMRGQRENIRGRIKDLIVYLVLLWAMLDDEDEAKANASAKEVNDMPYGVGRGLAQARLERER